MVMRHDDRRFSETDANVIRRVFSRNADGFDLRRNIRLSGQSINGSGSSDSPVKCYVGEVDKTVDEA